MKPLARSRTCRPRTSRSDVRYLLDTNILSAMLRSPDGGLIERIRGLDDAVIFTSIIVAAELRFGAVRKASTNLTSRIVGLLESMLVEPLKAPAEETYATIRAHLERAGMPIGNNDIWIAAHALATDSILVTDNVREFSRVPGLKIENWLR
jgi:tRNA(fMet)-specific endonuclease VapC